MVGGGPSSIGMLQLLHPVYALPLSPAASPPLPRQAVAPSSPAAARSPPSRCPTAAPCPCRKQTTCTYSQVGRVGVGAGEAAVHGGTQWDTAPYSSMLTTLRGLRLPGSR